MRKVIFGGSCMITGMLFLCYLKLIGWDMNHDVGIPMNILGWIMIAFGFIFSLIGLKKDSKH